MISVIVPVYNVEPYLHRCVDSILAQTFTDFDLILVDDGSPDNCPAICDEYAERDNRVHVIHQENGGLSAARNAGIDWAFANSDSQWLTFVDSDDWIHPEMLEQLLNAAVESNVAVSMCRFFRTANTSLPPVDTFTVRLVSPIDAYILDGKHVSAFACGRLYRKTCFQTIRFPVGRLFEDLFTTYKILFSLQAIALFNEPLYYYYQNPSGITRSHWVPHRLDELDGYEEQLRFFKEKNDISAFRAVSWSYLVAICTQFNMVNSAAESVDAKYVRMLRSKLRRRLHKATVDKIVSIKSDAWIYEAAHPVLMKCYWITLAAFRKIKKSIR
ncbi:MAG: glycosyltransferase family 2 protein [Evtepia sp.]|nr:glycosyltransferase family 2 protein [Evtepia sp.]